MCKNVSVRVFTLIELLVVIGIIIILISILLPALKSASETARQSYCSGNLKQIALAEFSYAQDYGDFTSRSWKPDDYYWYKWYDPLIYQKYLPPGSEGIASHDPPVCVSIVPSPGTVWNCPSEKDSGVSNRNNRSWGSGHYEINSYVAGFNCGWRRVSRCPRPTQLYYLSEHGTWTKGEGFWCGAPVTDRFSFRHRSKINMCYGDGHIATLKPSEVSMSTADWEWSHCSVKNWR